MANTGQKAVLVATGTVVLAGVSVALLRLAKPTETGTQVDLGKCSAATVACEVFSDGGYTRKALHAKDCRSQGSGIVITDRANAVVEGSCGLSNTPPGQALPHECACKGDGPCDVLVDGQWLGAPEGETLGPGYPPHDTFRGCVPKACVELMGRTSWPKECPRKRGR